jgi:hypothetical protein
MPTCRKCGITQASAEMRRSPKKGPKGELLWLCKEALACAARRKELRKKARALARAAASQS